MAHLMKAKDAVPGGHVRHTGYWWPFNDITKPEYSFTVERLDKLRQIPVDSTLKLAWLRLMIEIMNTFKLRVSCANCKTPHAMKDAAEDRKKCAEHYKWIRDKWMVLGTSRIQPVDIRGTRLDAAALGEVVEALKAIENLVILASETVACRRGFGGQSRSWMPWDETNGAELLR